jgi:hypothetical protein
VVLFLFWWQNIISALNCLFPDVGDHPVISLDSEGEIEEGEEEGSVGLVIR